MSHTYRLTLNVSTDDRERATRAVLDVVYLVEGLRCIAEAWTVVAVAPGVYGLGVTLQAASDAEAEDIAQRVQRLPGLPPLDAVAWRQTR
jgi:hypothetical protein